MVGKTGSRGNQATHNHVFLESTQAIALAGHRRFGQYAGRLLEGGRGNEALGSQRGLGDTQQLARALGRDQTLGLQALVFLQEGGVFHLFALDQGGVTGSTDHHLA